MSHSSPLILKKGEFRTGGPRALPVPGAGGVATPSARARITRKTADGAVIEVICGCGQRIELHCRWDAPAAASAGAEGQQGNGQPTV